MDQTLFTVNSYEVTGTTVALFGVCAVALVILKRFFSGGVCRIRKDLTGKVAVITGGNAGIGEQTALRARDKAKLQSVLKKITAINPKIEASYCCLDLGSRTSIENFAEYVKGHCQKIDYLINNAGVMFIIERRVTEDGLEMQIGVNHFGHFLLTHHLMPLIKKAEEIRVINVSSMGHNLTKGINFEDIQSEKSYHEREAYYWSKLGNIYFSKSLQSRFDKRGLKGKSVSLHPGAVRTELGRYLTPVMKAMICLVYPLVWFTGKSSKEGAQTTLYTVLEDFDKLVPGEYYADCKVKKSSQMSRNQECAERLWKISEETWKIKFDI